MNVLSASGTDIAGSSLLQVTGQTARQPAGLMHMCTIGLTFRNFRNGLNRKIGLTLR